MLEIRKTRFGPQRSVHERARRRKTVARATAAVVILLFLCIIIGIIYVWYMGQRPVEQAAQVVDTRSAAPTLKTYTPDPDAPVSIVLQSFTGTAKGGDNVTISIKTNPKAPCQISFKVNNVLLPDTGLVPKIADDFGIVDWSWTLPKGLQAGKWPVEITCANEAKKSAYYKVELEVTKSP